MADRIRLRRDTAANWTTANPVLLLAEAGYETDTGKLKLGNGTSTWTQLTYLAKSVNWLGAYSAVTAYSILDAVSYNGQSYICKAATTGNLPTNTANWDLMAQKGDAGAAGSNGSDGSSIVWRGAYSGSTTYTKLDAVSYNGQSYLYKSYIDSGALPTNTIYWDLMAQKGDAGAAGSAGVKGDTGDTGAAGAPIVWKGAYSSATLYSVLDAVFHNGQAYICKVATTNTPPTDTTKWDLMVQKGDTGTAGSAGSSITWRGAYSGLTAYVVLDAVSYNGQSYICKAATLDNLPTDTTKWDLMAQKGADGAKGDTGDPGPKGDTGLSGGSTVWKGQYSSSTAYVAFDAVSNSGSSYVCILANTNQPVTNTTYWALLAQKGDTGADGTNGTNGTNGSNGASIVWRGAYSNSTAYVVLDAVSYNGQSYICKAATTGALPTDTTKWDLMAEKGADGTGGSTSYASALDDAIVSSAVGGAPAQAASIWKTKTLSQVFDYILFPDLSPLYTVPTLSLTSAYSGFLEVGSSISQVLTLVGTKNDAGSFTVLTINKNGSQLNTVSSPSGVFTTPVPNQFGFANPNTPNVTYTLAYTDSVTVPVGTTTWSSSSVYELGQAKKTNKNVTDLRTPLVRSGDAPQAGSSSLTSNTVSIVGGYPYYWGVSNTLLSAVDIADLIATNHISVRKVLADASSSISIVFNASGQYLWFAHEASIANKTSWFNTEFNHGPIGANEFIGLPTVENVSSGDSYWVTVPFDIYTSNVASDTTGSYLIS